MDETNNRPEFKLESAMIANTLPVCCVAVKPEITRSFNKTLITGVATKVEQQMDHYYPRNVKSGPLVKRECRKPNNQQTKLICLLLFSAEEIQIY